MPPLPAWITPRQYAVLERLVAALEALGAPYAVSGGLAGNLHGSAWPLHDIDVDVPRAVLPALARTFAGAVRRGPAPYRDAEFELELLTLDVGGVEADLAAAESVVLRAPDGTRHPCPTDLNEAVGRPLGALCLRVQPLHRLIAYKRVIGRAADLADLEALDAHDHSRGRCLCRTCSSN